MEAKERRLERERQEKEQNDREKEADKINLIDLLAGNNQDEGQNQNPDQVSPQEFSDSSEEEEEEDDDDDEEITITQEAPLNDAIQLETRSAGTPSTSGQIPRPMSSTQSQRLKEKAKKVAAKKRKKGTSPPLRGAKALKHQAVSTFRNVVSGSKKGAGNAADTKVS